MQSAQLPGVYINSRFDLDVSSLAFRFGWIELRYLPWQMRLFLSNWKTRLVSHLPSSVSSTLISRLMLNIRDPKNSGLVVASTSYSAGTFDQTRVISFLPVSRRSSVTVWHAKHDACLRPSCNSISAGGSIYSVCCLCSGGVVYRAGWWKAEIISLTLLLLYDCRGVYVRAISTW